MNVRTAGSVARLVTRDHADLCAVRNLSIAVPANGILRGILVESSGAGPSKFYAWMFLLPLYVPTEVVWLNMGKRIRRPDGAELWDAEVPSQLEQLRGTISADVVTVLRRLSGPSEVVRVGSALGTHRSLYIEEAVAYSLILDLRVHEATEALSHLIARTDAAVVWQGQMAERARRLVELLQADVRLAFEQLEQWESFTIQALRLEKCIAPYRYEEQQRHHQHRRPDL